jgi:hypothetical protein
MALTYLDAQMIEQPAVLDQLSATNLQIGNITGSTSVIGDLTVYGVLTALSGFNVIIASTTSTSALSVSNIQASPALDVYQGPASPTIAIFNNQTGNIVNINSAGLTVTGTLSTSGAGDSNLWNTTYTNVQSNSALWASNIDTGVRALTSNWQSTYLTVSTLSASWEESADILPTVTNYLSTSNVRINSLTVTGNISATGTASVSTLNIVSGTVFPKNTFNNLVSALAINVNGTVLYMPLLSAI